MSCRDRATATRVTVTLGVPARRPAAAPGTSVGRLPSGRGRPHCAGIGRVRPRHAQRRRVSPLRRRRPGAPPTAPASRAGRSAGGGHASMVPHRAVRVRAAVRGADKPGGRVRDDGPVPDFLAAARSAPRRRPGGAVELARAAAIETAGDADLVGEHLGGGSGTGHRTPTRSRPRRSARWPPTPSPARCPATSAGTGRSPWRGCRARTQSRSTRSCCCPESGAAGPGLGAVARAAAPGRPVGGRRAALDRGRRRGWRPAYLVDDDSAEDPEGRVVAFEIGLGPRAGDVPRGPPRRRRPVERR